MTLAYVFWHQPRAGIDPAEYRAGMRAFHDRLAAVPIPGFRNSWTLGVPDLPWLPGGGYEDWYLVDDFAALGTLAEHAVDPDRVHSHDVMARAVHDGAGGVYALLAGENGAGGRAGENGAAGAQAGWVGWFRKREGVGYPPLRAELTQAVQDGVIRAVWQRQLVLGPAPEFRISADRPVTTGGADLTVAAAVTVSG